MLFLAMGARTDMLLLSLWLLLLNLLMPPLLLLLLLLLMFDEHVVDDGRDGCCCSEVFVEGVGGADGAGVEPGDVRYVDAADDDGVKLL